MVVLGYQYVRPDWLGLEEEAHFELEGRIVYNILICVLKILISWLGCSKDKGIYFFVVINLKG